MPLHTPTFKSVININDCVYYCMFIAQEKSSCGLWCFGLAPPSVVYISAVMILMDILKMYPKRTLVSVHLLKQYW